MKRTYRDFRAILWREYEVRVIRNPRYSLRAYAKTLEISQSRLSEILKGRYGLSVKAADLIADKLGLSPQEKANFVALVEENLKKTANKRNAKTLKAAKPHLQSEFNEISLDAFAIISEWYHYAIIELCALSNFKHSVDWIAEKLNITPIQAEQAIKRLERVEVIKRVGKKIKVVSEFNTTSMDIPSKAIKSFHRQIIQKAIDSIESQSVQQRDHSSMILTFDPDKLSEAKEAIQNFRRDFDAHFGGTANKKKVYCLAIQFFDLTERHV